MQKIYSYVRALFWMGPCLGFNFCVYADVGTLKDKAAESVAQCFAQQSLLLKIPNIIAPGEVIETIASQLRPSDCEVCQNDQAKALWKREVSRAQVNRLEGMMRKYGDWISLPQGGKMSPVAPTQEFWVEVMENNPSKFKDQIYCQDTYREAVIHGKVIGMCPDFPMEQVSAINRGLKNSDIELIARLNQIYQAAGYPVRFRRQTKDEYHWADTEGGANPKLSEDAFLPAQDPRYLGRFTPFWEISHLDIEDPSRRCHSEENQPRSMMLNAPNAYGFRRSGVWEWTQDRDGPLRILVGGSWHVHFYGASSGYLFSALPRHSFPYVGPGHLVRF